MPFGKSRSGGRLGKRCAFLTGKERDSESANDYFGARYYFAGNARWLSADPEQIPQDPQQLNLYVYVRNDPVNLVDTDGAEPDPANPDFPFPLFPLPLPYPPPYPPPPLPLYFPMPLFSTLTAMQQAHESYKKASSLIGVPDIRPECLRLFEALGVDRYAFLNKFLDLWKAKMFFEGPTFGWKVKDLSPSPDFQQWWGRYVWKHKGINGKKTTVKDLFKKNPGMVGWSPMFTDHIFVDSSRADWTTYWHEVFHKVTGKVDEDILQILHDLNAREGGPNIDVKGVSGQFNEEIRRRCDK